MLNVKKLRKKNRLTFYKTIQNRKYKSIRKNIEQGTRNVEQGNTSTFLAPCSSVRYYFSLVLISKSNFLA